jgi:hypothetical protein
MSEEDYGKATVGYGTPNEREIPIEKWLSAYYVDGRKFSVVKLENNNYILTIENHESSGRDVKQQMMLTEGSLIALIATVNLFMTGDKMNFENQLNTILGTDKSIQYNCSDNFEINTDE